jgi:hypothetical protein
MKKKNKFQIPVYLIIQCFSLVALIHLIKETIR